MSVLLGAGGLPSGAIFTGAIGTPTGAVAGVLPANGSLVSLAAYPTLSYLNTGVPYLVGPALQSRLDTLATNFTSGDPSANGHHWYDSTVIGNTHFLCGYNTSNNYPAIAYSTDLVNWTVKTITGTTTQWCFGIVKVGSIYYAGIVGVAGGQNFIYTSADLSTWTLAYTAGTGSPIYGSSIMAATGTTIAVLQGGATNALIYNGTTWSTDTNNVNPTGTSANLSLLGTGELASVSISGTVSWVISAAKLAPGGSSFTKQTVDANFTSSVLVPTPTNDAAPTTGVKNGMNFKISAVGGKYVINAMGIIYTSPDFVTWTKQGDKQFVAMENIGGTLYAIAYVGGVQKYYSSADGVTWTLYYTSSADQDLGAFNFGARIVAINASLWAVCSCGTGYMTLNQANYVAFIFNPTTAPIVMQTGIWIGNQHIDPWAFNANAAGTGILAGPWNLVPPYNPLTQAVLPQPNVTGGTGLAMFMKI